MDSPHSKEESSLTQACYSVPFGHVPYTPSLPGAMGPLLDFPIEWWYYGGWATDVTGTKQFTIMMQTVRLGKAAAILYGIGIDVPGTGKKQFTTYYCLGEGQFPTPTSTSWSTDLHTTTPIQSTMTCKLTSGILGLPGATYQLDMTDTTNKLQVSLLLKDTFGMILEGPSGAIHKTGEGTSFEFSMPSLAIQENSTITMDEIPIQLGSGNLWLDRQTVSGSSGQDRLASISQPGSRLSGKPLYTGNWLAVTMNDETRFNFTFIWPNKPEQWIVGTKLDDPIYPLSKWGIEYPALPTWDGHTPVQGVNVLKNADFDLNILKPDDPKTSPHWKSTKSGQTYCSAWHLRIRDKVYTVTAWIPGSETFLFSYFFEGAATICDENGCKVGCAFVEQMGYN